MVVEAAVARGDGLGLGEGRGVGDEWVAAGDPHAEAMTATTSRKRFTWLALASHADRPFWKSGNLDQGVTVKAVRELVTLPSPLVSCTT